MSGTPAKRDKRTDAGARRYARQVGDHYLLFPACSGTSHCARAKALPGSTCSACRGAVLTPEEKRGDASPG